MTLTATVSQFRFPTRSRFGEAAWAIDLVDATGELLVFYPFVPVGGSRAPAEVEFENSGERIKGRFESLDKKTRTLIYREIIIGTSAVRLE